MEKSPTWTFDRVVNLGLAALAVGFVVALASYLSDVLLPFVVALLLAYVLDPLVSRVQKKVHNRGGAVSIVLGGTAAAACLALWLLVPSVLTEFARMGDLLARLATDSDLAQRIAAMLPENLWDRIREQLRADRLAQIFQHQEYLSYAKSILASLLPGVAGVVSGSMRVLLVGFGAFLVLVYLVFMLLDFGRLRQDLAALLPERVRGWSIDFIREFDAQMSRYFRAQALISLILAAVFAVAFWLIGLPLGIVIGIVAGLSTMVPYLQLVTVPPALLLGAIHALDTGSSVGLTLILVVVVFLVVQALQDWVLAPRILGGAMGLSPVMILLSISVWGKLLGFLGLVMAIPFTCLVLAYWSRFLATAAARKGDTI